MRSPARSLLLSSWLAALVPAQRSGRSDPPPAPVRWYAGDTHEHFQACFTPAQSLDDILARLEQEGLAVGSVLVWNPDDDLTFPEFACLVTGTPDPLSSPERALQFGVETSGLGCGKWGHLIGLGIGPEQALIAQAALLDGDCADAPGLVPGCGGDGTGVLNAPVAARFLEAPGAVCGYAHSLWPLGLYDPRGFPWHEELVTSGFTRDARVLDPAQGLAVPNLVQLFFEANLLHRTFFPILGAVDAVLGEVQFLETIVLRESFPLPFRPRSNWQGLAYKLSSLGLRIAYAAGSDQDCAFVGPTDLPRTYVWLTEPFGYAAWTRALAAGRTSTGIPGLRIDMQVAGRRAGDELRVEPGVPLSIAGEVVTAGQLHEAVELLAGGQVIASAPVASLTGGRVPFAFDGVQLAESTWIAVQLASQRAHSGPLYVIVDRQPIADAAAAEYWMLWCDILVKTALQVPQLELFGCQRVEALTRAARARRAFKTYRDIEGFDPAWNVTRYGRSTGACRGPISIGTMGPAVSRESVLVTCVNAPPLADGVLHLSRRPRPEGPCVNGVELLVATGPGDLLGTFPARSTRSGFAEVLVPEVPAGEARLYAQFVWTNPPGCEGSGCGGGSAMASASDALEFAVEQPDLVAVAVTPTAPAIALGTSLGFTAMGLYDDGTKRDLTGAVAWRSSDPGVVVLADAPGMAGLATAVGLGGASVVATDAASGVEGATTLTVTAAALTALEVAPQKASLALGFSQPFTATGTYTDLTTQDLTGTVLWSSSNPAVAGVANAPESAGVATALAVGATDVVATDAASGFQASSRLSVTEAVLTRLELTPAAPEIALGTSLAFTGTGVFSDGTTRDLTPALQWSSSDPIVATIVSQMDGAGLATSLTPGTSEIRATDPWTGVSGATQLTVTPAVLVSLALVPPSASVPLGLDRQFAAIGTFTDGTTQDLTGAVTWSSSEPGVAVVSNAPDSAGLAQTLALGTTLVTAMDPETGSAATAALEVTPAVLTRLDLAPEAASVALGFTRAFTACGTFSDGSAQELTRAVTWSSSEPAVAVISNAKGSAGVATSLAVGTAVITAIEPGSMVSASATLAVTPAVLVSLAVLPADPPVALGFAQPFTALGTSSDGTVQDLTDAVTWSSSDPAVAVVSNAEGSEGLATTLAVGATTVTALEPASQVSGASTLTVTPAVLVSLALAPLDSTIGLGTSSGFTATGAFSDGSLRDLTAAVTWSSSDPGVASISNAPGSQGLATSHAVGVTTIQAREPKSGVLATTTLTVRAVLVALTVSPAQASVLVGAQRAFTALGGYNDGTSADLTASVLWSSSDPAVATLGNAPGNAGIATGVSPGLVTVRATDPATGTMGSAALRVLDRR